MAVLHNNNKLFFAREVVRVDPGSPKIPQVFVGGLELGVQKKVTFRSLPRELSLDSRLVVEFIVAQKRTFFYNLFYLCSQVQDLFFQEI